jgi:lysyl-tRNA synthetase class 2
MNTGEKIRKERLEKLKSLRLAGFSAYPLKTNRTHTIKSALNNFKELEENKKEIVLVGRIRLLRVHGGATFFEFEDGSERIQCFLGKNQIGEKNYEVFLDYFDIGDFVEVRGVLMKTKRGEQTIQARDFKFLTKSLRPLPEKWQGLKEVEERYRKRYLDLIFNPEVKEKFRLRFNIIKEIRNFLEEKGFLSVETPILQRMYGGARAKPFTTHLNSLDLDLFLRVSPELFLKKLLIGGFEKVYEIGKCFRNEGMDREHNPDFTMLEFYWAYSDYKELMKLTEEMFAVVLKNVFGKTKISYEGKELDFTPPWPRVEFFQFFEQETGIKLNNVNREFLLSKAKEMKLEIEKGSSRAQIIDEIYKTFRNKIVQPTFLIHYPEGFQPLAKSSEHDGKLANFQLLVDGMEICNAFSELNDPIKQRERLEKQEKLFSAGSSEAQRMDKEFLEALEYGMPPAAGFGMGIDRLIAILTDSHSLRETILFPIMKPKK